VQQQLPGIPKLFHFMTCDGSKDNLFSAYVDMSLDLHPEANGTLHQPSYYIFLREGPPNTELRTQ
jgi:hypothetical protein